MLYLLVSLYRSHIFFHFTNILKHLVNLALLHENSNEIFLSLLEVYIRFMSVIFLIKVIFSLFYFIIIIIIIIFYFRIYISE